jgi:hypothetical protein
MEKNIPKIGLPKKKRKQRLHLKLTEQQEILVANSIENRKKLRKILLVLFACIETCVSKLLL